LRKQPSFSAITQRRNWLARTKPERKLAQLQSQPNRANRGRNSWKRVTTPGAGAGFRVINAATDLAARVIGNRRHNTAVLKNESV